MSQMSQVPQVSECRHLEMGKECGDFPDDQVTIFWRNIMALMDNFMAIRLESRHDVFRVSNMNANIMHTCIIHIVVPMFTCLFWNPHGKNIWTSIDFHFSMSPRGFWWVFPKGRGREQCGWHEGNRQGEPSLMGRSSNPWKAAKWWQIFCWSIWIGIYIYIFIYIYKCNIPCANPCPHMPSRPNISWSSYEQTWYVQINDFWWSNTLWCPAIYISDVELFIEKIGGKTFSRYTDHRTGDQVGSKGLDEFSEGAMTITMAGWRWMATSLSPKKMDP